MNLVHAFTHCFFRISFKTNRLRLYVKSSTSFHMVWLKCRVLHGLVRATFLDQLILHWLSGILHHRCFSFAFSLAVAAYCSSTELTHWTTLLTLQYQLRRAERLNANMPSVPVHLTVRLFSPYCAPVLYNPRMNSADSPIQRNELTRLIAKESVLCDIGAVYVKSQCTPWRYKREWSVTSTHT